MGLACGLHVVLWAFMLTAAYALRRAGAVDVAKAWAGGVCAGCGYSLAGTGDRRCPECGGDVATLREEAQRREQGGASVMVCMLVAGVVAHAPAAALCAELWTYFDAIYFVVVCVLLAHAAVAAAACAIVSTRGARWLTVSSAAVLVGGVFALEAFDLWHHWTYTPTGQVEYADLQAALMPLGVAFVVVAGVVSVVLWWRGPRLAIAPVEKGPVHAFPAGGQEVGGMGDSSVLPDRSANNTLSGR